MALRTLALATLMLLSLVSTAWAQGSAPTAVPPGVNADATFPAWLGYTALGVVSAAGTTLVAAIKILYGRNAERDRETQATIDALKVEQAAKLKELYDRLNELHEKNEKNEVDRRTEQEKLLREQKDIMKDVLITTGTNSTALGGLSSAVTKLDQSIGKLEERIAKLEDRRAT